ncbi:helix-turn-helix domain-containing protein [Inquilinus sp. CA228]|uniref:helix-turn-helix domain-containing protein n=1 Tax=Inquilinus sp. CA228 TaxID=3455609 RepID=UPI003F8D30D7
MSKLGQDLIKAMTEAVAIAKGEADPSTYRVHHFTPPDVDVRAARKALGMTQEEFAPVVGVSASGLRKWEQGVRQPNGAARTLIRVIEREPEAVKRALSGS